MTNDTLQTTILTPEVVKSKLQIALTRVEKTIQNLNDREAMLVYNEDCLLEIKEFIEDIKEAKRLVDAERKRLKEPSLIEGRNIDAGAKLVDSQLDEVLAKANLPYQKLCIEVEKGRQAAEVEKQRLDSIRANMERFWTSKSVEIAGAKSSSQLVAIERVINLETANKHRYMELLPDFVEGCKGIRSLLSEQKNKVRELEELERKSQEAAKNGSDEVLLELMDKKENLEAEISEKKILVQEEASNQAQQSTATAEIIIPLIPKGGRRQWKYEVVDIKAAQKAGLTKTVIDEEKVDAILAEKRKNEKECTENGVRYFIERRF